MTSSYNNQDIYISKLKFFRMKYLKDQLTKYKMTIKYGTESKTVDFECISDNVFEVDLSGLNIKFTEIYEATFQM